MKVGIIGGGAAGIMSALFACKRKDQVTVIEHNDKLLKKILSTGNGKCNFTNLNISIKDYHNNRSVANCIKKFNQYDTIKFFNSLGIVEYVREGYVYPNSEQAASIRNALLTDLERYKKKIILNAEVTDVNKKNNIFSVHFREKGDGKTERLDFDKIIVATGLKAAPKLGSDGSFLPLLSKLGVRYNKCLPALCAIDLDKKDFFKIASGVRSKGSIEVMTEGKSLAKEFGELQFVDKGISGIPTFQVSRYVSRELEKRKDVIIKLDFFSHLGDVSEIFDIRRELFKLNNMEEFGNGIINSKLWSGILKLAGIKSEMKVSECDKKHWIGLKNICTNMEFKATGMADFDKCQVCSGGVSFKDLDENLMHKEIKNLYFAGEVVDVDGICGGYNLQWAWTSGYIAGNA